MDQLSVEPESSAPAAQGGAAQAESTEQVSRGEEVAAASDEESGRFLFLEAAAARDWEEAERRLEVRIQPPVQRRRRVVARRDAGGGRGQA